MTEKCKTCGKEIEVEMERTRRAREDLYQLGYDKTKKETAKQIRNWFLGLGTFTINSDCDKDFKAKFLQDDPKAVK